eukprot:SAG22_NODE_350_length_11853_cov_3.693211_7_plen_340_part_00
MFLPSNCCPRLPAAGDNALAQVDTGNGTAPHHFFGFDWKPCSQVGNWAAAADARPARFQLLGKAAAGRAEWANVSIQAFPATQCDGKPCFLEGSPMGRCAGAPDYSSKPCGGAYTQTCFSLLSAAKANGASPAAAAAAVMRYGDAVQLQDGPAFGRRFLSPETATFSVAHSHMHTTTWTLVDPDDVNSTAVFAGGAFALRPGGVPPPYLPPAPPAPGRHSSARPNRTLYLSHSENLAMDARTNGTVRASTDGGTSWPWTFQVTKDEAAQPGTVFTRQAFGYSCLSAVPANSSFGRAPRPGFIGLLWESSAPDCQRADASCAVKFSAVPRLGAAGWVHNS